MAHAEEYRAYREVIAAGIKLLRPHTEVRTAGPTDLDAQLERFGPQVVVCGVPGRPDPGDVLAWVELHEGAGSTARVRVGDGRREAFDLTLGGAAGDRRRGRGARRGGGGGRCRPGSSGAHSPNLVEGLFRDLCL